MICTHHTKSLIGYAWTPGSKNILVAPESAINHTRSLIGYALTPRSENILVALDVSECVINHTKSLSRYAWTLRFWNILVASESVYDMHSSYQEPHWICLDS
jgi:hypothetical protein